MTADRHPIAMIPEWMPREHTQLVPVGEHFEVVRIAGLRGRDVADALRNAAGSNPGPIVREAFGREWVHFLVEPDSVAAYRWPPGILTLDGRRPHEIEIPALITASTLLVWHSHPTETAPVVRTHLMHTVLIHELADVLDPADWTPEPKPGG